MDPNARQFLRALWRPVWVKIVFAAGIFSLISEIANQLLPDEWATKVPRAYNLLTWVGKHMPIWGWFAFINLVALGVLFDLVYKTWVKSEKARIALPQVNAALNAPNLVIGLAIDQMNYREFETKIDKARQECSEYEMAIRAERTASPRQDKFTVPDRLYDKASAVSYEIKRAFSCIGEQPDILLQKPHMGLKDIEVPTSPNMPPRMQKQFDPATNGTYFDTHHTNFSQMNDLINARLAAKLAEKNASIEGRIRQFMEGRARM